MKNEIFELIKVVAALGFAVSLGMTAITYFHLSNDSYARRRRGEMLIVAAILYTVQTAATIIQTAMKLKR